jgi:hypothetical protein
MNRYLGSRSPSARSRCKWGRRRTLVRFPSSRATGLHSHRRMGHLIRAPCDQVPVRPRESWRVGRVGRSGADRAGGLPRRACSFEFRSAMSRTLGSLTRPCNGVGDRGSLSRLTWCRNYARVDGRRRTLPQNAGTVTHCGICHTSRLGIRGIRGYSWLTPPAARTRLGSAPRSGQGGRQRGWRRQGHRCRRGSPRPPARWGWGPHRCCGRRGSRAGVRG